MTYKLEINPRPTFLHFIVTGQNNRTNAKGYINDLLQECRVRGCFRVLIEERLEGPRLGFEDVFQIVSEASRKARGLLSMVAYVDVNAEGDLMKFAETIAVNRSVPMAIFSTVADAEEWLLHEDSGSSGSPEPADKDAPLR
jgi:hypothetical protein